MCASAMLTSSCGSHDARARDASVYSREWTDCPFDTDACADPGVTLSRVWNSSSAGVLDDVAYGRAHMTEPYFGVTGW